MDETRDTALERIGRAAKALLAMQRHSWEQGLAMQAFFETGDMDTVVALAYEAVYRAMPDGRCATIGVTDAVTDPASVGEALLAVCEHTGDDFLIEGERKLRAWALEKAPGNENGIRYHLNTCKQFWADSTYMLPPYLAAAGYKEEALKQFNGYWDALFDETAGLLIHMWDDEKKCPADGRHWGIGNGWCLMAIARLIGILEKDKEFARAADDLAGRGKLLLKNVLSLRSYDGSFHDILDDPSTFDETGTAQMCAYTIYRGLLDGWIDEGESGPDGEMWRETADSLRKQAERKQDRYGFIQGVCGAPTFDKSGIAPEQQAIFMMMENAYIRGNID